ncbi:MAG TPA: FAD-dependent oxidoreductase [Chthonomonadaceae bacterium]|nr:FAD-dependent oxidoreductase [Chthonomonadaceae bacterium]
MRGSLTTDQRVVILGAGPTGLGAAYRLQELGHDQFHIYDRAGQVGGLATSHKDAKGFTWDIGGHVQFSHYRYFDDLMDKALGSHWLHHERESWVWIEGRFVPYPFQNNIRYLRPETCWKCLQGLVRLYKQPFPGKPQNFREWISATLGEGLAEVFMVPYNFKVWAYPATEMDYNWIGERVAVTDLERVLDNVLHEKDDLSWGPNNTFRFPEFGGTGAVWEHVADILGREKITLNKEVAGIDPTAKQVFFSDGTSDRYDVLISTLPIDRLVHLADLSSLKEPTGNLRYSSTNIIGVGLSGKPPSTLTKKCWMYFPEDNCPFYRVTVFSNYSPNNVPDINTQWSLMAEVSESHHKPVDTERVIEDTIEGMFATKLINKTHDVLSTWSYRAHYGYPTPALGRDKALEAIHPELQKYDIYSRGRFGGWKYEVSNQDHSMMQGVELVDKLVLGIPEVTYWFPATANNMAYAKQR